MRRVWVAAGLVGFAVLGTGCLPRMEALPAQAVWDRLKVTPAESLMLQTGLIDRPAGDPYLNRNLWSSIARPLGHQLSTLQLHNGLRVGVFSGSLPGEFDRMIHSEHEMTQAMNRPFYPGKARVVPVNGPIDSTTLTHLRDLAQEPQVLELSAAECGLNITAFPAGPDQIRLTCELQIQHGLKQTFLKPSSDNAGFTPQNRKPLEVFPELNFEVTLGPNDYLVVGPSDDPVGKLGAAYFIDPRPDRPRQRLLVIRASRPQPGSQSTADAARTTAGATAGRRTKSVDSRPGEVMTVE